jgi:hypothetical protein
MKKLFSVAALFCVLVAVFAALIVGCMVSIFGIGYFLMADPQTNWIKMFEGVVVERRWLLALMITIAGSFTAVAPLVWLATRKHGD